LKHEQSLTFSGYFKQAAVVVRSNKSNESIDERSNSNGKTRSKISKAQEVLTKVFRAPVEGGCGRSSKVASKL
jgi:hypothetical protein